MKNLGSNVFEQVSLDQLKELFCQVADGRVDKWRLQSLLCEKVKLPPNYEIARSILGDNFIAPEEIEVARHLPYNKAVLAHHVNTIPSESILRLCKKNGYTIIAGPPSLSTLYDIYGLNPRLFTHDGQHYGNWLWANQCYSSFFIDKSVSTDWAILKKSSVSSPNGHTAEDHEKALNGYERVPDLIEVTWGITTLMEVRGILPIPDGTSSGTSTRIRSSKNLSGVLLGAYHGKISPSLTDYGCSSVFSALKNNFVGVLSL